MFNREELKENILLASSSLGMDIDLNKTNLSKEEQYALKRELIDGFKMDPVVATFLTNTLKDGINFDWLEMYEDKRALYQINLGIIQGIDMSFSKKDIFNALQLEAIRQWAKRGVDMKDLSFSVLSHKKIRALAGLKQAGCEYITLINNRLHAGYLNNYLEVYKQIKDLDQKAIFLNYETINNTKRLLKEGVDIEKLSIIGFFDAYIDIKTRILSQLGIAFREGYGNDVKWVFDHIELFSIQEFLMFDALLELKDLKEMKLANELRAVVILKALGAESINGDVLVYQSFFEQDDYAYTDRGVINCINYGIDLSPLLRRNLEEVTIKCIISILHNMVVKEYDRSFVANVADIFDKSLDLINDNVLVFKTLNRLVSNLHNYSNVDFEILLDQSIPDESKTYAIIAKHLGLEIADIKNLESIYSYYRFAALMEKQLHPDLIAVIRQGVSVEDFINELNNSAKFIDISKLNLDYLSSANMDVLVKFSHLKDRPGFYELWHKNLSLKALYFGLDALELGLDILPVVKPANSLYAEKVLKDMIEEHLGVENYVSRSENGHCAEKYMEIFL